MEDFGYKKQKKAPNNGNFKKKLFLLAIIFSFGLFFWIVLKSYYFITNTNQNEIETIKAVVPIIKVSKSIETEAEINNNSIYEDILHKKGENIDDHQIAKITDTAKQPTNINNENLEHNTQSKTISAKTPEKLIKEKPTKTSNNEEDVIKVQIAAMSSAELAEEYWQKIVKNQAKILKNYQHFIEKIDLNNKGILFRLKIGDFTSKNEAENFCQQFILHSKKTTADCIILN
jgi:cell division septation protein DedD